MKQLQGYDASHYCKKKLGQNQLQTGKFLNDIQLPQQQSKLIQDAYEKADNQLKEKVFAMDISENIIRFCFDKYQHYIIMGVIEKGLLNHKRHICRLVNKNIEQMCQKKYAYKIVQLCLQQSDIQNESKIIQKYVMNNIQRLQFGQYGNLIIGTLMDQIQNDVQLLKLIDQLQIDKLKFHQYGCILIIKIAASKKDIYQFDQITNNLIKECVVLATSEYSNYIIQKMLTDRTIEQNRVLINDCLIPNFLKIACDKFGSNVCEIMLNSSLAYQLMNLWHSVIKFHLRELLNNQFANYVMQTYYANISAFSYIAESFLSQLNDLNKNHQLNKNGKIVFCNVMQCNQMIQKF